MSKLTHNFLVKRAIKWLYSYGCGFAVGEIRSFTVSGEIPDAIGFKSNKSILIECKVSRADFLKDKNKYFRQNPEEGMGNLRLYLCPKDIIKIEDLPDSFILPENRSEAAAVIGDGVVYSVFFYVVECIARHLADI